MCKPTCTHTDTHTLLPLMPMQCQLSYVIVMNETSILTSPACRSSVPQVIVVKMPPHPPPTPTPPCNMSGMCARLPVAGGRCSLASELREAVLRSIDESPCWRGITDAPLLPASTDLRDFYFNNYFNLIIVNPAPFFCQDAGCCSLFCCNFVMLFVCIYTL